MEYTSQVGQLGTVLLLLFSFRFTSSLEDFEIDDDPSITYPYDRFDEIKKHCGFILPSASELEPDDNRGDRMKNELSFKNGDWHQDTGKSPLVPFDCGDTGKYYGGGVPLNLVSFWVVDVDPLRLAKNAASVSGIMEIGISRRYSYFTDKPYKWSPTFSMSDRVSKLTIPFEGLYIESENNGGEYLMCFLGNATFPASQPEHGPNDQILLFLRYPKTFALQTRGIAGEMRSLNQMPNITYFDKVHISSQLGFDSKYSFGSEELVAKACDPYPYPDKLVEEDIMMFQGDDFCEKLVSFADREVSNFIPSWEDADRYDQDQTLGPFVLPRKNGTTDWNLYNTRLMIQDVRCEARKENNGTQSARVSAFLRVIQASEDTFREELRTGLSSTTLSAEGIWRSSNGQLCMVGCIGPPSDSVDRCSTRICLYLPLTFSIKQRSLLYGTISSMSAANSYSSLKFEKVIFLKHIVDYYYNWDRYLKWSYKYSKIELAIALQKRLKPSKLVNFFRSSFLRYPSLKGTDTASVSFLADVLSNRLCAVPHTLPTEPTVKTFIDVDILSMGALFGRYLSRPHQEKAEIGEPSQYSSDDTIPIAGQMNVISQELYNISLFFEGLYDPRIGCMYVIGCRNLPTSKRSVDDGGMDCLIEATIQYPPRNLRWLLNPKIKLTIKSYRSSVDPLYLKQIKLNTFPDSYSKKPDDQLFRIQFERLLRILLLSVAYLCTSSQSTYMNSAPHGGAYTSVVMLGVLSLGYSIPLITGDEGLFRWKEFGSSRTRGGFDNLHCLQVLDTATKSLLVAVLLLTAGLAHRVWAIRGRKLGSGNGRKIRIPSEKLVFLVSLITHTIGFFLFHVISEVLMSQSDGGMKLLNWFGVVDNYAGIVQDLFLLPQIIGNVFWNVQGKPLRKTFYLGFTLIRCSLHAYDFVRDPQPSNTQRSDDEFQYLGTEFYTKFGNASAGLLMLVLAGLVFVQQRYICKRSTQMLKIEESEESEDLTSKSELYEMLLSM